MPPSPLTRTGRRAASGATNDEADDDGSRSDDAGAGGQSGQSDAQTAANTLANVLGAGAPVTGAAAPGPVAEAPQAGTVPHAAEMDVTMEPSPQEKATLARERVRQLDQHSETPSPFLSLDAFEVVRRISVAIEEHPVIVNRGLFRLPAVRLLSVDANNCLLMWRSRRSSQKRRRFKPVNSVDLFNVVELRHGQK